MGVRGGPVRYWWALPAFLGVVGAVGLWLGVQAAFWALVVGGGGYVAATALLRARARSRGEL